MSSNSLSEVDQGQSMSTPPLHDENPVANNRSAAVEQTPSTDEFSPQCACNTIPGTTANAVLKGASQRKRKRRTPVKSDPKVPRLTQPLSELTKDFNDYPIRDMAAWVDRPAAVRRSESNERKGYVTRPMNSFFLYRLAYADRTKAWCLRNDHTVISAVSGQSWPLEPEAIRHNYIELAKIERRNHSETYPNYKFLPVSTKPKGGQREATSPNAAIDGGLGYIKPDYLDGTSQDRVRDGVDGVASGGENDLDGEGWDDDLHGGNYKFDIGNYYFNGGDQIAYGMGNDYDYDSDVSPLGGSQWGSTVQYRNISKRTHSSYSEDGPCYPIESDRVSPTCAYPSSAHRNSYRFEYQEANLLPIEFVHASQVEIEQMYTAGREVQTEEGGYAETIVVRSNRGDIMEHS